MHHLCHSMYHFVLSLSPRLQVFTNSAAALSAEVGPDGEMVRPERSGMRLPAFPDLKGAWQRRVEATEQRRKREAAASK